MRYSNLEMFDSKGGIPECGIHNEGFRWEDGTYMDGILKKHGDEIGREEVEWPP